MSERSLKAYDAWRDEAQRFDYFILGLIGALAAYVAQNLKPQRLGWSPFTLELVGLFLLVAAAFFGFRRIEHNVALLRQTHARLEWEDNLASIVENYRGNAVRTNLGEVLSPDDIERRAQDLRASITKIGKLQEATATASGKNYQRRNWCLLAGFLILIVARILQVYS